MTETEIREILGSFSEAWSRGAHSEVANHFCEDGIYQASIGPEPGHSATGRTEIETLVKAMSEKDQKSTTETTCLLIDGQSAAWKWTYRFPDGSVQVGCDFFEFRQNKIALKDAYRKIVEQ